MGKLKKAAALLTLLALLIALPLECAAAELYHLKIEQVDTYLPQIVAYTYILDSGDNAAKSELTKENITATVGGENVRVESVERQRDSGHGVCYYYLVDVSTSVSSQFSAMKSAIAEHIRTKGEKDRVAVITFGSNVEVALDGTESPSEAIDKLDALRANSYATRLYDGISKALSLAEAGQSSIDDRAVIFLATDGEDFSTGSNSEKEVLQKLEDSDIPIFGFGYSVGGSYLLNAMGELVRDSGGVMRVVGSGDIAEAVKQAVDYIGSAWRIELAARTNVIADRRQTFALSVTLDGKVYTGSEQAIFENWIKDESSPTVAEFYYEDGVMRIVFSEPVTGADKIENYSLREGTRDNPGKTEIPLTKAVYDDEKMTTFLTPAQPLSRGVYVLSLSYIRDVSVEKNPIYQADVDFTVSEGRISLKYIFTDMIYIPIIAGVLLIGLIVLLVLLIRRKKRAAAAAADSAEPSAEHESGDAAPHDEVHLNAVTGLKVDLAIVDKRNVERQVTAYISGSYIVGRGRGVCELSIEDDQLSRQHFALIYENETLKIQDLQSTNGTLVNGIRLEKPRALKSGDVIEAGNSRIIVLY